ncbi:RagB/SusD family nutrient uptake outer membrane protein [Parapedobacter lycopersici]|uniref:RagB/SusD family nutrient uptake outer membrane protein n=1 Tax=Parapedobacter lycopersici TaxID=1864939 RepID=UPI00214DC409|nr:RagB/SusD family nutrient uptake outer membrane protein [Parapedobacter lycopersici]
MEYIKRKYITSFTLLASLTFLASGCGKDLLQETPKSFVSATDFYTNARQIEGVFANCMNYLYGGWGPYDSHYEYSIFDDQYADGNLIIPVTHGNRMWTSHYKAINDLNHIIRSMNEKGLRDESPEVMDGLMGKARFLRGWNYFQLVRYYGPLPLLTDATENYYAGDLARSPITEIYDFIIGDFEYAIGHIPATVNQGEPGRGVAKAMLAETYLTMASYPMNKPEYYSKAAEYAWEVISEGKYALVEDVNRLFTAGEEHGKEMMWGFYATQNDPSIEAGTWYNFGVSLEWLGRFPEQPRKSAWFMFTDLEGNYYLDVGINPSMKKYLYAGNVETGLLTANMSIMRYADVLLIYAEAANMANGGPTDDAVWAINQVIDRANGHEDNAADPLATRSMSQAVFDKKVIAERNWELCFEGPKRWFDLIRKRILKDEVREEYQINFSEDDYLWPIPLYDLRNNPNLEQNPGYPRE